MPGDDKTAIFKLKYASRRDAQRESAAVASLQMSRMNAYSEKLQALQNRHYSF